MPGEFVESAALVSGGPAWLLDRILRSPDVAKVMSNPPAFVDRDHLAATGDAIHRAARAYESRLDQRRREGADPLSAVVAQCWTTEQTASYLGLSLRRSQELAAELGGRRIGRRWSIPASAIHDYAERKKTA